MIWCRSSQPTHRQEIYSEVGSFLSPIEQAYLGLSCYAKTPFHSLLITKVHLLSPKHRRTGGGHIRGHAHLVPLPLWPSTPSSSSDLSAFLHVVGKVGCLPVFLRFSQEA